LSGSSGDVVEGSTRQWENDADGVRAALAADDELLRAAIEAPAPRKHADKSLIRKLGVKSGI
jgi:hypothetical protein